MSVHPLQPIFWHQGLFLQPQHFQHNDNLFYQRLALFMAQTQPYPWGVLQLELDEAALQTLDFRVLALTARLRDGSFIQYPGNAVIESRGFELADLATGRTVYLGLRRMMPGQANVSVVDDPGQAQTVSTRMVAAADPVTVADDYAQGPEGQLDLMNYVLRVFWDEELPQLGHYELLAVARLEQDGDQARLQRQYIPPSLNLSASPWLIETIRRIRDELTGRARQLEVFKPGGLGRAEDLDGNHLSLLVALQVLNRYGPMLNHVLEAPQTHPWQVYGLLRQLVGELSTFSERYDMMGETRDGKVLAPPYQHEDLAAGFHAMSTLISALLNEIVAAPELLIRLQPVGASAGLYEAELPDAFFAARQRYHLVAYAGVEQQERLQSLAGDFKLCAPDQVELLVTHSLGGVELLKLAEPPRGIPRRPGALYCYIDPMSPGWAALEQTRAVSLVALGAPENLQIELIVSKW
ncbi:type VI secretion system baseplate subunit TssK [Alcaligenes sp. SJTW-7]|uniref:type VI secretion system baseplate subunit TssK n=1 Tax=Alcaligenes sp. SJTW-7 TaxID=3078429 RepID=UPI0039EB9399